MYWPHHQQVPPYNSLLLVGSLIWLTFYFTNPVPLSKITHYKVYFSPDKYVKAQHFPFQISIGLFHTANNLVDLAYHNASRVFSHI